MSRDAPFSSLFRFPVVMSRFSVLVFKPRGPIGPCVVEASSPIFTTA